MPGEDSAAFARQVRNRQAHPACGPCEIDCASGAQCPAVERDLGELSFAGRPRLSFRAIWASLADRLAFAAAVAVVAAARCVIAARSLMGRPHVR